MTEKKDTFDKLVESLNLTERREMLDRLADVTEVDTAISQAQSEAAKSPEVSVRAAGRKRMRLADEGFFVRLWFNILAFFSSSTAEEKYNAYLIADLGRKLSKKYGAYILVKRRMYTTSMYQEFASLEKIRSFFIPYVTEYNKNRGDFYILLSSIITPDEAREISAALDPFSEPYESDIKKDIHIAFLKKMDNVFNSFPSNEKSIMYQAAQAAEWLSAFIAFPLNQIILQFSDLTGKGQMCLLDMLTDDLKKLSSILASSVKMPVRLIEALFMFLEKDKIEDKSFAFDQECTKFVRMAVNYLSDIVSFRNRIPLADFMRFSSGDILWEPDVELHGEDWFKLFKIAWKERFEARFAEWQKLHEGYVLKRRALSFLGCRDFPELEYAPWKASWIDLKFHRETVFLFLKAFFSNVYPGKISKILKVVLAEGDFYKRENLAEFTDAFNVLEHSKGDIADFEMRLSPKGDLGEGFSLALTEKIGTHTGKIKLDRLMITLDSETDLFCTKMLAALQSMNLILEGILNVSRSGQYDTLSNLSSIHGFGNETFRSNLSSVRVKIQECIDITDRLSGE